MIMRRTLAAPDGWPPAIQVASLLLESQLVTPAGTVSSAEVLSVRDWSVVYGVRLEGAGHTSDVVVKSIREPHHRAPGEGANHQVRSLLELRTLELARSVGISMPRPIGVLPMLGAIVMERVSDRPLLKKRSEAERRAVLHEAGRRCRDWHRIEEIPRGADYRDGPGVLRALATCADAIDDSPMGPAWRPWWDDVFSELARRSSADRTVVPTHGDLHAGNVWIADDGGPMFVDGAITLAHPVADVAQLAANLRCQKVAVAWGSPPGLRQQATQRVDALLSGFGPHNAAIFALHELHGIVEHWDEVRKGLPARGATPLTRIGRSYIDRSFGNEVQRWFERYASVILPD